MATVETIEKWTAIINAARLHPQGVKAYCLENRLEHHTYYNWFHRLKPQHPEWEQVLPRGRGAKKNKQSGLTAGFVAVKVVDRQVDSKHNVPVEIRLTNGAIIVLPNGLLISELANLVQKMEIQSC